MKKKLKKVISLMTTCAVMVMFCVPVFAGDMTKFPYQNEYHYSKSYTRGLQVMLYDFTASHSDIALGGIDGSFGPKTADAVEAYQENKGLEPDGSCGPATWNSIRNTLRYDRNNSGSGYAYYYMTGNYRKTTQCMRTQNGSWYCYDKGSWYYVG